MSGTLVVGDVHGCSDELALVVADTRPEHVVLVGDLFTKGPDPAGVWHQIREGGYRAVLGNHDHRLLRHLVRERKDKEARRCVRALDTEDRAWRHWLAALPLTLEVDGWTVVHAGLHPSGDLEKTTRSMCLTMRRYPLGERDAPFWWERYTGPRRVVFGHDARRGLVRVERDGAPWLVGLDTGCVYGGELSGYLLDEDRVVQVPARRPYKPVG